MTHDLLVLGAGPAGITAAVTARQLGLTVALIDEAAQAGGQIYRAPTFQPTAADLAGNPDLSQGERLRDLLRTSDVALFFRHRVWEVAPGPRLAAVGPDGPVWFTGRAIVVATGTTERVIPVPGSTLPGVIGLTAATILLKAHAVVPSGPLVVAGVGPLLYAVAAGALKAGGTVAAVVDLARPADWLRALPGLSRRPDLLRRGLGWLLALRHAGVRMLFGHTVAAIRGEDAVAAVEICPVAGDWACDPGGARLVLPAACLALGHGLVPASEAARALGVAHHFRAERGGWVPEVTADCGTAAAGVYVAGDCAGIAGAAAAELSGTLAALGAARDLETIDPAEYERRARPVAASLHRAARFGAALGTVMTPRPGLVRSMPADTVVCRCEDVCRDTIDRAVAAGVRHVNQLKSTTRCGMGPCQGRMCGEAAGELVALGANLSRATAGQWTVRPPLRPVPLAALLGNYDYDDIPKPPPAPA